MEILKEDDRITPDDVEGIKDLEEVSTVNCLAKNDVFPVNFQLVTGSDSTEASNQKASLLSYDNLENDSGFSEGVYRLVSGSYIAEDIKGIVINSYLADANQLKLGDLIELENTNGKRVPLEIVGIFLSGNESRQPEGMDSVNRIENQIFIDNISYSDLFETDGYAKVAVYCKNPEQLNVLEEELNKYLSDTLYQQMALPLEQITRAAKLMLALTLLAGTVIVSLLLCMWMRTRQKETAIFISIGKSKASIFLQVFMESFFVFAFAVLGSCCLGNFMAGCSTPLLFFVVFMISLFFLSGMASRNASITTQNKTKQAVGAGFLIEANEANKRNRADEILAKKTEGEEGNFDGVNVEKIETNYGTSWRVSYEDVDQSSDLLCVSLIGNKDMALDANVLSGNVTIKDGRMITEEDVDVCVISEELAEKNNLSVGNRIQFNDRRNVENRTVFGAEIVGIYRVQQKMTPVMAGDTYRSENIIFTDLGFPEKAEGSTSGALYKKAYFKVADVNQYDEIKKEIQKVDIGWERYDLIDNNGNINKMSQNFNDLENISQILVIVVAGARKFGGIFHNFRI